MGDSRPVFTLDFGDGRRAPAARVADRNGLEAAVRAFGLSGPRPVVAVVGGAGGMTGADLDRLGSVVARAVLPVLAATGAVVVDGGTDAGVMRLMGRARDDFPLSGVAAGFPLSGVAAGFPLIGVAAERTVILPGQAAGPGDRAPLEPHHSHFLLVPGTRWGQEVPWLADTATVVAGAAPSVTLLINGGAIAVDDAAESLRAGRPVLVLAGSGRTADRISAARGGERGDERVDRLADHPDVHLADGSDPEAVRKSLSALLRPVRPG
ncbi:hypothetical protein [Actinoplanes sp. M2I2]|uniref:hypothetical protein n=1 Tax=Actinoplanes sp. M2I2 TaxID=1734444 RepID=UPI00202025EC|nr:hypothetical protein [Actinoplanes sp. M2I2]